MPNLFITVCSAWARKACAHPIAW